MLLRIFDDHGSWETPVLLNLKMEGSLAKIYKLLQKHVQAYGLLVGGFNPFEKLGGFNPFEKHESKRIISPGRDENKPYLKPPPSS